MILVLGATGRIGSYLFKRFKENNFDILGTYYSDVRNEEYEKKGLIYFDLKNMNLDDLNFKKKPTHIIIVAAVNPRPELSKNLEDSYEANVLKTKKLIKFCFEKDIIPIYPSSDNVFDGEKGDYKETDKTNPLNNYGKIKCEIENYLFTCDKPYVLLRMGKVFGVDNDSTLILETFEALKKRKEIYCATDQIFTPTYAEDLYEFLKKIIKNNYQGIFHLGSIKPTTRYEIAQRIKNFFKIENTKIIPCKINEIGLSEKRPLKIDLNIEKYKKLTGKQEKDIDFFLEKLIVSRF